MEVPAILTLLIINLFFLSCQIYSLAWLLFRFVYHFFIHSVALHFHPPLYFNISDCVFIIKERYINFTYAKMARNNIEFNSGYLSTHRGIIKILQIIFGFVTCSLLCSAWYGGRSCFYDGGRVGFASGLNFVIVIINIVLFILNLLNASIYSMERIYSVVGLILFIIAFALMLWFIIEYDFHYGQYIAATVFIGLQMGLFIWDYQILHGQAFN